MYLRNINNKFFFFFFLLLLLLLHIADIAKAYCDR